MKWPFREPSKFTDWVVAFAAVVGVFVALMQIHILALQTDIIGQQRKEMERQRDEMAGQRKEMANAGKQTDRIIAEDRRLADANEKVARGMTDSVSQAKLATNKSLDQSRKSLEATIEMSRNDQRAWLGLVNPHGEILADSPLRVTVVLRNFGRTPALNVRPKGRLHWQPAGEPFKPCDLTTDRAANCGILQPTEEVTLPFLEHKPLTKDDAASILSRQFSLYLYGEVRYDDIFEGHHCVTFAYEAAPDLNAWQDIATYSTAD